MEPVGDLNLTRSASREKVWRQSGGSEGCVDYRHYAHVKHALLALGMSSFFLFMSPYISLMISEKRVAWVAESFRLKGKVCWLQPIDEISA